VLVALPETVVVEVAGKTVPSVLLGALLLAAVVPW